MTYLIFGGSLKHTGTRNYLVLFYIYLTKHMIFFISNEPSVTYSGYIQTNKALASIVWITEKGKNIASIVSITEKGKNIY